jgi:hypothetical protein
MNTGRKLKGLFVLGALLALLFSTPVVGDYLNVNNTAPANNTRFPRASNISTQINVTGTNATYNCTLFMDGANISTLPVLNKTLTNFSIGNLSEGIRSWYVNCSVNNSLISNVSVVWNFEVLAQPCVNMTTNGATYTISGLYKSTETSACLRVNASNVRLICGGLVYGNGSGTGIGIYSNNASLVNCSSQLVQWFSNNVICWNASNLTYYGNPELSLSQYNCSTIKVDFNLVNCSYAFRNANIQGYNLENCDYNITAREQQTQTEITSYPVPTGISMNLVLAFGSLGLGALLLLVILRRRR